MIESVHSGGGAALDAVHERFCRANGPLAKIQIRLKNVCRQHQ